MKRSIAPAHAPPPRGWILYDDTCGCCRRWVIFLEPALRRRGFTIAPLQTEWVPGRLGINPDRLLDDFRLLLPGGRQLAGADAYRHIMRRIWWAWPLYWVSITPGLRRFFDWVYRTFAANRHRCAAACRLEGGA